MPSERPAITNRAVKAVVVILAAAAIATLGLLEEGGQVSEAVADHPLDDHFDRLMPRYPRASELPLGEQLAVGEGAMRMSYFATKDPPLRVARFYQTVWEQEGLSVHHDVSSSGGVVGTYDPRIKGARSVTIIASNRRTWVFPATVERPLDAARQGDMGQEAGLPVFPGSSRGLTLGSSDVGRGSLVATYSNDGGLEQNLGFYRDEMEARGWQAVRVPTFDELGEHRSLSFVRPEQRCTINVTPVGEAQQVIVSVIVEPSDG